MVIQNPFPPGPIGPAGPHWDAQQCSSTLAGAIGVMLLARPDDICCEWGGASAKGFAVRSCLCVPAFVQHFYHICQIRIALRSLLISNSMVPDKMWPLVHC